MILAVLGAGPHGREIAALARILGHQAPFFDDDPDVESLGPVVRAEGLPWVAGPFWPEVRRKVVGQTSEWRTAANLVHPAATVGEMTRLGEGVVVSAGAHLSINVRVGDHTHLGLGSLISRDVRLGSCVTVSPGVAVAGGVIIESDVFIGIGARIVHELVIGAGAFICAGATVTEDVAPGAKVR